MKRFLDVHELTAKWEGGWSNHKADPGGKTMYGVTEAVYHSWLHKKGRKIKPVRNITKEEALEIYYTEYWLAAGCDKLVYGVDRMVYDAAVNSGVSRSRRWLMQAIGGSDTQTVKNLYNIRMNFLRNLRTWRTFGKGWTNRVNDVYSMALKEVGMTKTKTVVEPTEKPAEKLPEVPTTRTPEKPETRSTSFSELLVRFLKFLFRRQ